MEAIFSAAKEFSLSREDLLKISGNFQREMETALKGGASSLKMLPSYLGLPTGGETGEFIALDFGGTNVRAALVKLAGGGRHETTARFALPLKKPGEYDYSSKSCSADELFDFIAGIIGRVLNGERGKILPLGHTFSYPSAQETARDARLISWTKEMAVPGVEGKYVNSLLQSALERRGIANVRPAAVLNDTVAVLLTSAYQEPGASIGSIYATGHNSCYFDDSRGMILNMESGGFSALARNRFDEALDGSSENPGKQRLEKMTSGRYVGKLFSLAIAESAGADVPELSAADVSRCAAGGSGEITEKFPVLNGMRGLEALAGAVIRRSAQLVAATFAAAVRYREEVLNYSIGSHTPQRIGVEGSFYANVPLAREVIGKTLAGILGGGNVLVSEVKDGSEVGAAIAGAMQG